MKRFGNAQSMQCVAVALFAAVAVIGLGFNSLQNHRDQEAYANGMALLAAQAAEPTVYSTFEQGGVTWYRKCEKGHCWSAANPESLEGAMVRTGGSAGIPVTDMNAARTIESR